VNSTRRKSHKILIISDCYVGNCVTEIQHNLDACEVSGFIKPGPGMDVVANTARDEMRKLRSEDVVVVWGGANDISKNNTKAALKHVCNFVKKKGKYCDNEIAQQTRSYTLIFYQ